MGFEASLVFRRLGLRAGRQTRYDSQNMRMASSAIVLAMAAFLASGAKGDSWPQFRGPDGQGNSGARDLPLAWSEEKNVKWKTAIHGRSWSSPVIWGEQIWLTTATEDGRELFAVCVDR